MHAPELHAVYLEACEVERQAMMASRRAKAKWQAAEIAAETEVYAARGITPGTTVITTGDWGKEERASFLGVDWGGGVPVAVLARLKKDGTASKNIVPHWKGWKVKGVAE